MADRLTWVRAAGSGHHLGYAGPVLLARVERSDRPGRTVGWKVTTTLPVTVPPDRERFRGNELAEAKRSAERVVSAFLAMIGATWRDGYPAYTEQQTDKEIVG